MRVGSSRYPKLIGAINSDSPPGRLHIPSLDGLRAVAFTIVFVSHSGFGNIIPGGFGVTIFFFLSGFLITFLLRHEYQRYKTIDITNFYLRRVLRIFPPLYISLAIMIAMVAFGFLPGTLKFWPVLSEAAFMTNYYVLFGADPTGIIPGSGVLWSLAVEEHFYLVFPFFLALTVIRMTSKQQAFVLGSLCLLVLAWRILLVYGMHATELRTYLATDTRIDSILFGCVLALSFAPSLDKAPNLSTALKSGVYLGSISLLLISFLYRDEQFRNSLRYTVQGVALLPLFYFSIVDLGKPWFSWLNWNIVRFFGTLTYTMYLIHLSIISSIRFLVPDMARWRLMIFALAITSICALAMYLLVERPLTSIRRRLRM